MRGLVRRRSRTTWAGLLLQGLVFALALALGSSGALPLWAQLARGEAPHVCHCSLEKHDCVCAKCNPDHDDLSFTSESLQGRCGDDEVAYGGKAICAVLPASGALAPISGWALRTPDCSDPDLAPVPSPPTPPPRASFVTNV